MEESQFMENLVERYLANRATENELEVFMDLLKQGKLDDIIKSYMDREDESFEKPISESSISSVSKIWQQWLQLAATVSLVFCSFSGFSVIECPVELT
jgi:transmembrane sensor